MGAPFRYVTIAQSGPQFGDFAPYVPSIDAQGHVAFQATLTQGGTGVFVGDGQDITKVADTSEGEWGEFASHPDIANDGHISVYATLKDGSQGVFRGRRGAWDVLAETRSGAFAAVGPLGPTMNHSGVVAFRAQQKPGVAGIFLGDGKEIICIADTREEFADFQGLPVINERGDVVFRADRKDGKQGIYVSCNANARRQEGGTLDITAKRIIRPLVWTGEQYVDLVRFPMLNTQGTVAFGAVLASGHSGIYTTSVDGHDIEPYVETEPHGAFASFRGVLLDDTGVSVFYATPKDGTLGIYHRATGQTQKLLALGEPFEGSSVVDFALNPVSINEAGQVAIRIRLADQRHLIVRVDTHEGS